MGWGKSSRSTIRLKFMLPNFFCVSRCLVIRAVFTTLFHGSSWYYCRLRTLLPPTFHNPFFVTSSKIVVYNRWKMRTKTITIQQLLPGLAWGEMSVEIALPTVYSSCECLSLCWCHFSLQDLPRKECQFRYCIEHETFSLLNSNQTRWRLFSFDFWIWNEGLLIGWI